MALFHESQIMMNYLSSKVAWLAAAVPFEGTAVEEEVAMFRVALCETLLESLGMLSLLVEVEDTVWLPRGMDRWNILLKYAPCMTIVLGMYWKIEDLLERWRVAWLIAIECDDANTAAQRSEAFTALLLLGPKTVCVNRKDISCGKQRTCLSASRCKKMWHLISSSSRSHCDQIMIRDLDQESIIFYYFVFDTHW